jgi:hypothetical protein
LNKHKSLIISNVQKILYFYSIWQPIYTEILNDNPNVEFIQGYKNECELLDSKEVNLIVLDDLMEECKDNPEIAKILTKASHHMNHVTERNFHFSQDKCFKVIQNFEMIASLI